MEKTLCKALGLDSKAIKERLRLLELDSKDKELIEKLHRFVIDPHVDTIVDEFYEYVMSHYEFRAFIQDASVVAKLTRTFRIYLTTLGIDFDTEAYFNDRLRVGIAHHRIAMPLMLYECAYRKLQCLLLDRIPTELNEKIVSDLTHIVHKIVSLDITLAVDSYNLESVKGLKGEIKDLFEKEEQMKRYASIDPLTRIYNRGAIIDQLKKICSDKTDLDDYCLIMMDLDNFREVNDRLGHLVGDYIIRLVVERVKNTLGKRHVFGRYGGDEFIIILKNKSLEQAVDIARELKKSIAEEIFKVGNEELSITVSQGVSKLEKDKKVVSNIQHVDVAMIQAKQKGVGKIAMAGTR